MALKAGKIPRPEELTEASLRNSLEDSMAEAMEKAFVEQWPHVMGKQKLPEDRQQMRLMFVAVAQGVVQHLHDNADAFNVGITLSSSGTATGEITDIEIV